MIKLALALGFIGVFGLVAFFGIVMTIDYFKSKNQPKQQDKI